MATVSDSIPHMVRTSHEPRQPGSFEAVLSNIIQVNAQIRLLRLSLQKNQLPLRHLPGQYVDLSIPNVSTVGGFTITSPPQTALPSSKDAYIELAIQRSAANPPAAYLWQPASSILNAPMSFRVGGNFAYPPLTFTKQQCEIIDRAVFIAGGVGINPIMSMLSAMDAVGERRIGGMPRRVRVLYTSRRFRSDEGKDEEILFEERLARLAEKWKANSKIEYNYTLFETQPQASQESSNRNSDVDSERRRIHQSDLIEALGSEEDRKNTVTYVCGVPQMTDEFVDFIKTQPGMDETKVLCEKWW